MKARHQIVEGVEYVEFKCPGCKTFHSIDTNGALKWKWNGSLELPTFEPSVLCWLEHNKDEDEEERKYVDSRRCHSFVRDGKIQFLDDCGHELAGQTVDLPEIDV